MTTLHHYFGEHPLFIDCQWKMKTLIKRTWKISINTIKSSKIYSWFILSSINLFYQQTLQLLYNKNLWINLTLILNRLVQDHPYMQPVSLILSLSNCWIIGSSPLLFAMFTSLFNCKISHELVWVPNNLFMRFSLLHLTLVFPELPHTSRKFLIGNCFIWKPQRVQGNSVTHWSYDKPSIRVDSEEKQQFCIAHPKKIGRVKKIKVITIKH